MARFTRLEAEQVEMPSAPDSGGGLECTICLEDNMYTCVVEGDVVCHHCITERFIDAIRNENRYPVKWGNKELNIDDFVHIVPSGNIQQFKDKQPEYHCPPDERIYCQSSHKRRQLRIAGNCGAFVGRRVEGGHETDASCPECGATHCLRCGESMSYLHRHDCRPSKIAESDALGLHGLTRGQDYQICPSKRCKKKIELQDGCNHICCTCGEEFCYICGKSVAEDSGHWTKTEKSSVVCPRYNSGQSAVWDTENAHGHARRDALPSIRHLRMDGELSYEELMLAAQSASRFADHRHAHTHAREPFSTPPTIGPLERPQFRRALAIAEDDADSEEEYLDYLVLFNTSRNRGERREAAAMILERARERALERRRAGLLPMQRASAPALSAVPRNFGDQLQRWNEQRGSRQTTSATPSGLFNRQSDVPDPLRSHPGPRLSDWLQAREQAIEGASDDPRTEFHRPRRPDNLRGNELSRLHHEAHQRSWVGHGTFLSTSPPDTDPDPDLNDVPPVDFRYPSIGRPSYYLTSPSSGTWHDTLENRPARMAQHPNDVPTDRSTVSSSYMSEPIDEGRVPRFTLPPIGPPRGMHKVPPRISSLNAVRDRAPSNEDQENGSGLRRWAQLQHRHRDHNHGS